MRIILGFLSAALLSAVGQPAAWAQDRVCTFVEWSYGYHTVEERGEPWTYVLTTSGPEWSAVPYGYHGPGWLSCERCTANGGKAGGLYNFWNLVPVKPGASPISPLSAAQRAERRKEEWGYPTIGLGPDNLELVGLREGLTVGPLSGYAILYRVSVSDRVESWANRLAQRGRALLVVHLTDGCVSFEVSIFNEMTGDTVEWVALDSFLQEVVITRTRAAETIRPTIPRGHGYSARVRAPPKSDNAIPR